MKTIWKNLKKSFSPSSPRASWLNWSSAILGFGLIPVALGIGVSALISAPVFSILAGAAISMSGAFMLFIGIASKMKTAQAAVYPGYILGRGLGWCAYSALHPIKTARELTAGYNRAAASSAKKEMTSQKAQAPAQNGLKPS